MANCLRCSGVTSTLAPLSQMPTMPPSMVGRMGQKAGRMTPTDAGQGSSDKCSSGTRAYHRVDVVLVTEQAHCFDHRAFFLQADDIDGTFVAADDLGGMDDFEARGIVGLAFQIVLQCGLVACEDEVQVRQFRQGLQGTVHIGLGTMVATETVYQNLYHGIIIVSHNTYGA